MKLRVVSDHLPHPEGTATGRHIWAVCDAWIAMNHDVAVWCYGPGLAGLDPPSWCDLRPFRPKTGWRVKPRTLLFPRTDLAKAAWNLDEDAVAWADDPAGYAAIRRHPRRAVTTHYSVRLDASALREWSLPHVQDLRAERRAVRHAPVSVCFSSRVAAATHARTVVPSTVPMPSDPLPLVEQPRVLMIATWSWAPNRAALRALQASWARVVERVPTAELLLAGRGLDAGDASPGVRVLGEVPRTLDAMAQAAVLAFPCPPTSGPKLKVLDALAAGLPVVTTESGTEGLRLPSGVIGVAGEHRFADALADVLVDPERRASMAREARAAVLREHSPEVAARARLSALKDGLA